MNRSSVSHHIRNIALVYFAELMVYLLACLPHLSQLPPNGKFLLTDLLSSLHSLREPYNTNPFIQRIHLTLLPLTQLTPNSHSSVPLTTLIYQDRTLLNKQLNMLPTTLDGTSYNRLLILRNFRRIRKKNYTNVGQIQY